VQAARLRLPETILQAGRLHYANGAVQARRVAMRSAVVCNRVFK